RRFQQQSLSLMALWTVDSPSRLAPQVRRLAAELPGAALRQSQGWLLEMYAGALRLSSRVQFWLPFLPAFLNSDPSILAAAVLPNVFSKDHWMNDPAMLEKLLKNISKEKDDISPNTQEAPEAASWLPAGWAKDILHWPLEAGARVRHPGLGKGTVQETGRKTFDVLFDPSSPEKGSFRLTFSLDSLDDWQSAVPGHWTPVNGDDGWKKAGTLLHIGQQLALLQEVVNSKIKVRLPDQRTALWPLSQKLEIFTPDFPPSEEKPPAPPADQSSESAPDWPLFTQLVGDCEGDLPMAFGIYQNLKLKSDGVIPLAVKKALFEDPKILAAAAEAREAAKSAFSPSAVNESDLSISPFTQKILEEMERVDLADPLARIVSTFVQSNPLARAFGASKPEDAPPPAAVPSPAPQAPESVRLPEDGRDT